jgi:exopolyphosphatase/guanosine-5'-triphosphate,3'-diphosphate pyrophosphatase
LFFGAGPDTFFPIGTTKPAVEPKGSGAAGRQAMDDEARATAGLDPAWVRGPRRRFPWGRRQGHAPDGGVAQQDGATYAALDLGTNNCRLLVARPTADGFRVIDAFSRIIRLGEGLSTSGRLSEAAISRALSALAICRDKMRNRQVVRARLIATEACRAAENGSEFTARVHQQVGLDLEVIDRETEAALAAGGCTPLVDPRAAGVILFDIGGGSSELVSMSGAPAAAGPPLPVIRGWDSLPLGVVTLAERYGGIAVGRDLFETMVAEVARSVDRFAAAHGAGLRMDDVHLLGTSGTVTTIAGVHLGLKRYDRRMVDGCWMQHAEITAVIDRLLAMSYEERVANACIGPERADLVLAGCAILEAIRRAFPCRRLRVADRGLREGMLVQMMREDSVWNAAARTP